ncbi:MAG: DUF262 domain-containing protein [Lachnospiraceae bacterium]|nr:DUF262 domain-containing protein [Lachnospiraceae bacterium]
MQTRKRDISIKKIVKNTANGNIVYDHPMQRKPGQWNKEQQSLLIHSILAGYSIPQAYALQLHENYDDSFSVLDGKQRFTTICDYVNDGFALIQNLPTITLRKLETVTGENGERIPKFSDVEYDISGKRYSELDGMLQEIFMDYDFQIILLCDFSDEDVETQFYRLNNGTALTKDQKTRVVLGDELARFLDEQEEKEFFVKKAFFTGTQRKQGAIQSCILQTLMMVLDYDYKDASNKSLLEFAEWFRANHKQSDLEYVADLFSKLNEALPEADKPYRLMKKVNIPIFAYLVQIADEAGLSLQEYGECILKFFDDYTPDCEFAQLSKNLTYRKDNIDARTAIIEKMIREWRTAA